MTETDRREDAVMREPGSGRGTWAMSSLFEHLLESPRALTGWGSHW